MSKDQMQDVFPIVFDFKKGEQPTNEKLTGLVKHTNGAFSRITQGIGDPWDYTQHTDGSLSLENLGQASLARILGSSDWLSPIGGCWNEAITAAKSVALSSNRNSWTLGFPLVKVVSGNTIEENSTASKVTPLVWLTDITVTTDTDGILTTEVASLDLVVADGDFFIDYYKGTITSYNVSSHVIILAVSNMNMFGAGVPWGTHNVIPHWDQTIMCDVQKISDTATTSTYSLTLPTSLAGSSRVGSLVYPTYGKTSEIVPNEDVTWMISDIGETSSYRLPLAITSTLSADDLIPEGYCLLWEGDRDGRVIPSVDFYYQDEHTLTLVAPLNWLSIGEEYRLITSGTSTAENINYLMQTVRNNEHVGLTNNPSISYTIPISHENLQDRFTSDDTSSSADRWKFRESSYTNNPHPQYLHRGGYMEDDDDGNSANAMRGDLVLAGDILTGFELGGGYTPKDIYKTAAIAFGGGNTEKLNTSSNAFIRLEGVDNADTYDPWVTGDGIANRIPFGLDDTGAVMYGSATTYEYLGALSLYPWKSTPLYLRGAYTGHETDNINNGAILGFDMGQSNEANYIRLMKSVRIGTDDRVNLPADVGQSATTRLNMTPYLSERIVSDQIREFRFRAVPYVEAATNNDDSIGGVTTRGAGNDIEEFEHHYTSPSIVGADFFNVYSNAIFFSDTGDGRATSFTTNGEEWLNNGSSTLVPSGLYYTPNISTAIPPTNAAPYLSMYFYDTSTSTSTQPFSIGDRHGMWYSGASSVFINGSTKTNRDAQASALILLNATSAMWNLGSSSVPIYIGTSDTDDAVGWLSNPTKAAAGNSINLLAHGGGISLSAMTERSGSVRDIYIRTFHSPVIYPATPDTSGSIHINSEDADINLTAGGDIVLKAEGTLSTIYLGGDNGDTDYTYVEADVIAQMYVEGQGRVNISDTNDWVKISNYKVGGKIELASEYGWIDINATGAGSRIEIDSGVGSLVLNGGTNVTIAAGSSRISLNSTTGIHTTGIKFGTSQGSGPGQADVSAGELWYTVSHATLPDYVLMIGA